MTVQSSSIGAWPRGAEDCRLGDLQAFVEHPPAPSERFADDVVDGVVVYRANHLRAAIAEGEQPRRDVLDELASVLADGPGVLVIRDAVDLDAVDRASEAFRAIIDEQNRSGDAGGDHFAEAGANDRIWNALEKLALADPEAFTDYYASDMGALAAEAWLGPSHQMSSQVNVINPGGAAGPLHPD